MVSPIIIAELESNPLDDSGVGVDGIGSPALAVTMVVDGDIVDERMQSIL